MTPIRSRLGRERDHLIFKGREYANMVNPALLVERADRLGPHELASTRCHQLNRYVRVHGANDMLNHLATLVPLGNDQIRLQASIASDGCAPPLLWTAL